MKHIENQTEYREIVSALYDEYQEEIETNANGVAQAHLASVTLYGHRPIVTHSAEYEGAASPVLDEALNPYEVIQYSRTVVLKNTPNGDEVAAQVATAALARDLNEH